MNDKMTKLRMEAEKILHANSQNINNEEYKDNITNLLEELAISQIELELQNEELRTAQLALEIEKQRFADLYINAPIGYFQFNDKGVILDFNNKASEILATPPAILQNRPFVAFVDKKYTSLFYMYLRQFFEQEEPTESEIEIVIKNSDSQKRYLKLKSNLMFDKVNRTKYCRTIAEDITDKKLAQEKSIQLNNRLLASMSIGNIAWWEVELPSGNVFFNENKTKMLGYDANDFTHYSDFTKLVHPDDYENMMQAFREHLASKKDVYECEYRIKDINNRYLWFHDIGKIVRKENENIWLTGIVTNITEHKATEEKLKELNATKVKFISILAHDLKNPFNAILGFSDLIVKNFHKYDGEKIKNLVGIIHSTSKNTYNLLVNLLEWSSSQSNKTQFRPVKLKLLEVVNDCYQLIKSNATQKNIDIRIDINSDVFVLADREMLKTVLRNLLTNSVKFTPVNGKVGLFTNLHENMVEICVSDNGIGIDAKTQKTLFKIGETQSRNGTEGEQGTGFGLLLCKEFVEKNGGKLWVESEPKKGSRFIFTVPLFSEYTDFQ